MSTFRPAQPRPLSTPGASSRLRALRMPKPELFGLLALAAVLNLWSLSRNGWANDYYAAAVRSTSSSWHNFFFGSFDASGVMTVDKPPLALWVQALSVRVFGYHSLSVLVPQALMGIASVGLVYDLTRRLFGRPAGFVAAGKIRWVVADSGGLSTDSRTGSNDVMSAVAKTCKAVTTSAGTIYDCQGYASALAALAS